MSGIVKEAVADRITGDQPNRLRALGAAIVVGVGAALLTYRLLRSDDGEDEDEPADD